MLLDLDQILECIPRAAIRSYRVSCSLYFSDVFLCPCWVLTVILSRRSPFPLVRLVSALHFLFTSRSVTSCLIMPFGFVDSPLSGVDTLDLTRAAYSAEGTLLQSDSRSMCAKFHSYLTAVEEEMSAVARMDALVERTYSRVLLRVALQEFRAARAHTGTLFTATVVGLGYAELLLLRGERRGFAARYADSRSS